MLRGEILDDSMEDEFYLRRLDAGLFVLQLICYIMVEICSAGVPQVHTHQEKEKKYGLGSEHVLDRVLFISTSYKATTAELTF